MARVLNHTLLYLILLSSLLPLSLTVQAQQLKAVYAQGYMPFSWGDESGVAKGVEIEFINAILNEKLGIEVNHMIFPWARAQSMVEEGSADVLVTIPTKKRRVYTMESDVALFSSKFLMHTGSSNPKKNQLMKITSLNQLIAKKDMIHGHIVGAGWHSVKLKNVENVQVAPSSMQLLQLLDRNRIDVYIEQAPLIGYQIKTLGYEGRITEIPHVIEETHWHICVGKKSSFLKYLPEINQLLKDMRKSGELVALQKEIFNRYR